MARSKMRFGCLLVLALAASVFIIAVFGPNGSASLAESVFPAVTGKVVGVHDGDTITLLLPEKQQLKIRLEAIDAPEIGQDSGTASKNALSDLVWGKTISARVTGQDRYGRSLAWLEIDGKSVNRRMVADGWAWQYLEYNDDADLASMQAKAKAGRLGIWSAENPPMEPWRYRMLGKARFPLQIFARQS